MVDPLTWPLPSAAAVTVAKERERANWLQYVAGTPLERRLNLGVMAWRYGFHRDGAPLCLPVYTHPDTGEMWAVLPEDLDQVQITYTVRASKA